MQLLHRRIDTGRTGNAFDRGTLRAASDAVQGRMQIARRRQELALEPELGLCIAVESRSAGHVGGDFHVVAPRDDGRVLLALGDACGRGPDAHALLPRILPAIEEIALGKSRPARVLAELNAIARREMPLDKFLTLLVVELDLARHELCVANAGHVPLLQRLADDSVRSVGHASGPPLGVVGGIDYLEERVALAAGDLLVLVTDGLLEAVETNLYAMSVLKQLIASTARQADVAMSAIMATLDAKHARRLDDITLMCVETVGEAEARARSGSGAFSCAS